MIIIENQYIRTITIAIALVFILALVGSASAGNAVQVKIKGNGKLVDGARIFESDNDAVAERTLQVTLNGPGKLAFFDAGTVHAENTDGSIVADVNVSKIQVSGKSTGTGTVVANATVRAEGHNILDDVGAVIGVNAESEIESFVDLEVGNGGTAEGTAFASGIATASGFTAAGSVVDTSATGVASASGKTGKYSDLYAEGEIEGEAEVLDDGTITDPWSGIWAEAFGDNVAQGSASASGFANATGTSFDGIAVDTSVEGMASASGTSTKDAEFNAESGIEAEGGHFIDTGNLGVAYIWTNVNTGGIAASGKASASASATGEAQAEFLFPTFTPYYNAEAEGEVKGSTSSSGIGESWALSQIEGYVAAPGIFRWEQPLPLDVPSAVFIFVGGDLVDGSLIQSEAGAIGEAGFKGSASTSAVGEAESDVNLEDDGSELTDFTNSFAEGMTLASASATGTGEAISGSVILSLDIINGNGFIDLLAEPDETGAELAPAQPPTDGQEIPIASFEFPNSTLADVSIIADFAMVDGESSKDTAKACSSASGETGATGAIGETDTIDGASADTFAAGVVNAAASVGAKADPFAASIIGSVSIPGIGDDSLMDASLIAGIAESAGPKGTASATASGTTAANGTVEFLPPNGESVLLESHTVAAGMTAAAASSTDGFALSFANIGSANYESFVESPWSADLVDVSLIGGVSTADGKASTSSTATGFTTSDGTFIDDLTPGGIEVENITAHTDAISGKDTVATSVTSFGGFGLAAAGVGSVSVVDWETGIPPDDVVGTPPASVLVDVSLIGDFVLVGGDAPKDTVTAKASADGVTEATGNVLDTYIEDLVFNVTGNSFAAGEVSGKAVGNAISDPISVSAILSVNVVDVENTVDTGLGIPSDSTLVDVSTITSASLASGKNGVAMGSAEGFTDAGGAVSAVDILDNVTLISGTFAAGEAETGAATTADGSLAISLAGQTAVDVIVNNEEPVVNGGGSILSDAAFAPFQLPVELPPEANMLIGHGNDEFDRLALAVEESGMLETGDKVCDEIGPFLQLLCDNREAMPSFMAAGDSAGDPTVVGVSAAGSAVFSSGKGTASAETSGAAGSDGFVARVYGLNMNPEIESETFTGADSSANVRTFGGFGIGAAGAASVDVVTFEPDFTGGVPTANIVDVSVIGDAVFAEGTTAKDTAKVTASAGAFTEASGSFETFVIGGIIPGIAIPVGDNSAESETSAEGEVFGSAESKYVSDPISASLIGSVSVVDMDPLENGEDDSVFDASLIASASFAADDYGKASGSASGITDAGNDLSFEVKGLVETLASDTSATGTAATDVSVKDGFGVGITVIGSVNEASYDVFVSADVDDTSFMFTYAAGQGNQVKSSAAATDALTTSTGSYEAIVTATDEELVDMDSETGVTGSGSSSVQVAGGHQADALSFMFADQEDFGDSYGQTSNAIAGFGVELDGCDNSPVTSTASLSSGHLLADADNDNVAGESEAFVEFTGIDAFAQLKPAQNIATIEVADSVPDLSYAPAGGADVDTYFLLADTNSQPNMVSYTRYGEAVSDENNLFVPDLQVLPILPFF